MTHLLSTKILEPYQKELLLNAGFGVVERDFIKTFPIPFQLDAIPENLIFTSQNAVKAVLGHPCLPDLLKKRIFAVGKSTTRLLTAHGFSVFQTADYGKYLGEKIIHSGTSGGFLYLCGKQRLEDLPQHLNDHQIDLSELAVYDTRLIPITLKRSFNGVLFFSPSGVKSFCLNNELSDSIAFCIGSTTAAEAKHHTREVITATRPSKENVIVQAIKFFKPTGPVPKIDRS